MEITEKKIKIVDLIKGFTEDDLNDDIRGYDGALNIRPAYQRNLVYNEEKQKAVINSILHGFPINVMYWSDCGDGNYELLDGQQRTMSICRFAKHAFHIVWNKKMYLCNSKSMPDNLYDKFMNYKITVYICQGNTEEKRDWFEVINTQGERLTPQELLNAVHTGPWLVDAKAKFSKATGKGVQIGSPYVAGSANRQEILETALKWITNSYKDEYHGDIEEYMIKHQLKPNAKDLWLYFLAVITWVEETFPHYDKRMKGLNWASMYDRFKDRTLDAEELQQKIDTLMLDDEVVNKKGIWEYVLDGNESHLNLRAFTEAQKLKAYKACGGICYDCQKEGGENATKVWKLEEMEADHIDPWHLGGKTELSNCRMLCKHHNRVKGGK